VVGGKVNRHTQKGEALCDGGHLLTPYMMVEARGTRSEHGGGLIRGPRRYHRQLLLGLAPASRSRTEWTRIAVPDSVR
jgi:hypothetical protein